MSDGMSEEDAEVCHLTLRQKLTYSLWPLRGCLSLLDHGWTMKENYEDFYEKCNLVSHAVEVAEEVSMLQMCLQESLRLALREGWDISKTAT